MFWRIGEILIQKKLISWDDLDESLKEQAKTREFIGEILIRRGKIPKPLFYRSLAEQFHLRYVDLKRTHINPKAKEIVPRSIAQKYSLMPIEILDEILILGIADPLRAWPEEEIRQLAKVKAIQKVLCLPEDIEQIIQDEYIERN